MHKITLQAMHLRTFTVCVRHRNNVFLAALEESKSCHAIQDGRQRVAVEFRLGKNTAAEDKAILTIRDIECRHRRMMGYLRTKARSSFTVKNSEQR